MSWQPIETALRDGTKMDFWIGRDGYRVTNVYWSDVQDTWCTDGPYGPKEPSPLAIFPAPTHWMPLPDPPKDLPCAGVLGDAADFPANTTAAVGAATKDLMNRLNQEDYTVSMSAVLSVVVTVCAHHEEPLEVLQDLADGAASALNEFSTAVRNAH